MSECACVERERERERGVVLPRQPAAQRSRTHAKTVSSSETQEGGERTEGGVGAMREGGTTRRRIADGRRKMAWRRAQTLHVLNQRAIEPDGRKRGVCG